MKIIAKIYILSLVSILIISSSHGYSQSSKRFEQNPKGMVFIPQGSFNMKVVENKDTLSVSVSLDAFWMSNEVTNSEYKEYVDFIKQHPDSLMCWVDLENAYKDKDLSKTKGGIKIKCLKYSEIVSDIIDVSKLPFNDYLYIPI